MSKGVYLIRINGSIYIGSTEQSFVQRKRTHLRELRNKVHFNYKLQQLYDKYGESAFEFHILEETHIDVKLIEQKYINDLMPDLNIAKTTDCPMKGRKHSTETRIRMLGKTPWNKGVPRTEEEKRLMSEVKKARMKLRPKEYFEALSERCKRTNKKPFLGKHHTDDNKKLLRQVWLDKYPDIICEQTGEIFNCQKDAALHMQLRQGHISEHLNGKRKTVSGFTFKYVKKS